MAPEVPVTVNAAGPFGVPVYVGLELLAHPTSTIARATTTKHAPNAIRRGGACRNRIMPAANNAASSMEISSTHRGPGVRSDGWVGNSELAVSNVSCNIVPLGGGPGATGLVPNKQDAFAGSPTQLSVKLNPDPLAAYTVIGITRFCPAVTGGGAEMGAKPATITFSVRGAEVLAA